METIVANRPDAIPASRPDTTPAATIDGHSAHANLMVHVPGSRLVTLDELSRYATPERTPTWHPISHDEVPGLITEYVLSRGWSFANRPDEPQFCVGVTESGSKMFGVARCRDNGYRSQSVDRID